MVIQELARKSIVQLKPTFPTLADAPISDIKQMVGVKEITKLSMNENPLGPSPKAIAAMSEALVALNRYPDGTARALRGTLGKKVNLDPRHVILTNGIEQGMQHIADTFLDPGDEVIIPEHAPAMYQRAAQRMGAIVHPAPLSDWKICFDRILAAVTSKTKLVVLGNPFDPTGSIFSIAELKAFLSKLPEDVLVAIDETYGDFAAQETYRSAAELILEDPRLMVLRTFSKFYGLADARIGYIITSLELGGYLNRTKLTYPLSGIALAGALASVQDVEHGQKTKTFTDQGKNYIYQQLQELGISFLPSEGNYVLVQVEQSSSTIFNALAKKGVIVRIQESLPQHFRVSIGTAEENQQFISALQEIIS